MLPAGLPIINLKKIKQNKQANKNNKPRALSIIKKNILKYQMKAENQANRLHHDRPADIMTYKQDKTRPLTCPGLWRCKGRRDPQGEPTKATLGEKTLGRVHCMAVLGLAGK